jgi:tRNA threonylcarbamoyl adenosine modification protein YeaZ
LAVLSSERVLWQCQLGRSPRTAATLAPAIDRAIRWCQSADREISFVSVAAGPGSFTGLRIAVTTAKTLSFAWRVPLTAVDSLWAIAASTFHGHDELQSLIVAIDAYRGQVFHATLQRRDVLPKTDDRSTDRLDSGLMTQSDTVQRSERADFQRFLQNRPPATALAGDPAAFGNHVVRSRSCDAIGVGLLGYRMAIRGDWVDPLALVPRYLRPSAAEEQRRQKARPQSN